MTRGSFWLAWVAVLCTSTLYTSSWAAGPLKKAAPVSPPAPAVASSPAPEPPSPPSTAAEARLRQRGFHLEPYVGTGVTRFSDTTTAGYSPLMLTYDIGITIGMLLGQSWILGATFDWEYLGQFAGTENGNFSGSRFNILAPTAATYWKGFLFKADLQLLGNYQFRLTNSASEDVELTKPIGLRLTANFPKFLSFRIFGADLRFFTSVQGLTYGGVKTTGGDSSSLGTRTKILSGCFGLSYIF